MICYTATMKRPETVVVGLLRREMMARARELEAAGVSRAQISRLAEAGTIRRLGRGLYALPGDRRAEAALAAAAKRAPRGVICLLSALQFHGLTTQLPREVWVAIGRRDWRPVANGLQLRTVRFGPAALREGVETHRLGGVAVRVFNPSKTVADCFKYRNKLGLDVALEALREGLRQRKCTVDDLARYAQIDRVSAVMRPYLEALA